jgi:fructokinase
MKFKNNKVLCVGEVLWDVLPGGAKPGGAPMNVAIHLKKFGVDVSMASRIGNDISGSKLKDFIEASGLSSFNIQTDDKLQTSKVLVHLDANNNATYEICEPVAWDNLELTDSLKDKAKNAGLIIFGTLAARNEQTRKVIMALLESDARKLVDINLRRPYDKKDIVEAMLRKADIAKLNDEEIVVIAKWYNKHKYDEKSLIRWIAEEYNCKIVVVTRGDHGAIAYNNGEFYDHPGFKVNVVDTVGSGDAFLAGFVASLLNGLGSDEALQFACATGAFVATQSGGTPDYSINDINQIINRQCPTSLQPPRGRS